MLSHYLRYSASESLSATFISSRHHSWLFHIYKKPGRDKYVHACVFVLGGGGER